MNPSVLHPKKILITGATGLVGNQLLRHLAIHPVKCFAALRPGREKPVEWPPEVEGVPFDFGEPDTYSSYLGQMDALFLMRPPALADVPRYFEPLIHRAQDNRLKFVLFLSVQGADQQPFIPHARIEKLLRGSGLSHCILRPSYFMQNFEQALWPDLLAERSIVLPAGKARFLPVDVRDIGAVAARILMDPDDHLRRAYDITGQEQLTFREMARQLSRAFGEPVRYRSIGPLRFYRRQRRRGMPKGQARIMTLLHWLPRFLPTPECSPAVEALLGRPPIPFELYARGLGRKIQAAAEERR